MPLYQYNCVNHGPFEQFRPMSICDLPHPCPTCEKMAPRQFVPVNIVTDATLFTSDRLGTAPGLNPNELVGEHYRKLAEEAGVVTRGKQHMQGLARYPGDPRAWVSSRAEMMKIAEEDNLNVTGIINRKAEPVEPQKPGLCETIAKGFAKKIMLEKPGTTMNEAMEIAVDRHGPPGHKRIIKKPPSRIPKMPKVKIKR